MPLSGNAFGRAYLTQMAAGHREALQMLDRWIAMAPNGALKQHLTTTRQHLATHLRETERLNRSTR